MEASVELGRHQFSSGLGGAWLNGCNLVSLCAAWWEWGSLRCLFLSLVGWLVGCCFTVLPVCLSVGWLVDSLCLPSPVLPVGAFTSESVLFCVVCVFVSVCVCLCVFL